ncbi:MAG: hypothetical protein JNL83_22235 [Myxococcales bacterium]|nr:hypothetical protein [Myxococcales bacterium]
MIVPWSTIIVQMLPQLIPPPAIVPVPIPDLVTVTAWRATSKVAVTAADCASVTSHVGMRSVQAPVQPAKTDPVLATAVSVTTVLGSKVLEQEPLMHVMPAGDDVTVPVPVPEIVVVSVT